MRIRGTVCLKCFIKAFRIITFIIYWKQLYLTVSGYVPSHDTIVEQSRTPHDMGWTLAAPLDSNLMGLVECAPLGTSHDPLLWRTCTPYY